MTQSHVAQHTGGPASRLDAFGWAAAFIWVGVAMLANVGWAWLLIGLGAIVLCVQAAVRITTGRIGLFWVACGLVLLAGGAWQLFGLTLPLAPFLLILLGAGIFVSAALRRSEQGRGDSAG